MALERQPAAQAPELLMRLRSSLERRDVPLSSAEPAIARLLQEYRLDGRMPRDRDAAGDFLALVEQNVSYGKLSPFIRQRLEYTVELNEQGRPLAARLLIDVENTYQPGLSDPGYPLHYYDGLRWNPHERRLEGSEGFYGGFTRLILPPGSQIAGATGFDEGPAIGEEGGQAVIGGYTALQMGARRRIQIEWLPGGQLATGGRYRLLVQRQPGAPDHSLTVRVVSPEGYAAEVLGPAADEAQVKEGRVAWSTTLDRDRTIDVQVRPSDTSATTDPSGGT